MRLPQAIPVFGVGLLVSAWIVSGVRVQRSPHRHGVADARDSEEASPSPSGQPDSIRQGAVTPFRNLFPGAPRNDADDWTDDIGCPPLAGFDVPHGGLDVIDERAPDVETLRVDIHLPAATLTDAARALQLAGLAVHVDPLLLRDTHTSTIDLQGILLRSAIDWICAEYQVACEFREGAVWLSPTLARVEREITRLELMGSVEMPARHGFEMDYRCGAERRTGKDLAELEEWFLAATRKARELRDSMRLGAIRALEERADRARQAVTSPGSP
jgi:hypothetical protein